MNQHKFKTWFPETRHMTDPWDFEDIARGYSCGMLINEIESGSLIGEFDEDAPESYKNCIIRKCTGIKDKNGIEIYDGDIVNFSDWKPKQVIYQAGEIERGFAGFVLKDTLLFLVGHDSEKLEIVGNIYENPELIDKKESNE